jgi:hypothetical protein
VIFRDKGCSKCSNGKTFTILYPNGTEHGESFGKQSDAQDLADELNKAYELGRQSEITEATQPPDVVYIRVRRMKIGFSGKLPEGKLRYWRPLEDMFKTIKNAVAYCPSVKTDLIYECKCLGNANDCERY